MGNNLVIDNLLIKVKKFNYRILFSLYFTIFLFFHISRTRETAAPITIKTLILQKILGFNRYAYWPVHHASVISHPNNILIGKGTAPGLSPGCYIQGIGKIQIGDYTIIGPNVGIISANHDFYDYRNHINGSVVIGDYCWIGMNSVILPDVSLGDHTIIAAGSIVTKSYPEGYSILAGNPAIVIKKIDPTLCKKYSIKYEYYGYIPCSLFKCWKSLFLNKNLENMNFPPEII